MKAVIAVLCLGGFPALLCAEELTLRWRDIPHALVASGKVEIRLTGGAKLHGRVVAMTPEGLRMEITKVRDGGGKYQEGEFFVPAGEITVMKVKPNMEEARTVFTPAKPCRFTERG